MSDQGELFGGRETGAAPTRQQRRNEREIKKFELARLQSEEALRERTIDSFQNFALNLGQGTNNALSGSTYGFHPVTRIRTLLEWVHRGSWLGGVAIDLVAKDMTRAGVDIQSAMKPDQIEEIQQAAITSGLWKGVTETVQWGRLYGGAIGVILIDGQDPRTPLREDTIKKGQFRGIAALDRWAVDPSLEDLVKDYGPDLGKPKYYQVASPWPVLGGQKVHYSRVIRHVGIQLPMNQAIAENLWGESVIERIYDRMVAFDSATQGAAQLVYKSALRVIKLKGLRKLLSTGGDQLQVLAQWAQTVAKYQSTEGITLLDAEDEFTPNAINVQSGISDALLQFAQQLAGALQIPLVRLLGQSPAGLNSTGESDLRTYYDGIAQSQMDDLYRPLLVGFRCLARSMGHKPGEDFNIKFRPLWQMDEKGKAEVTKSATESIIGAFDAGLISQQTGQRELRQLGPQTGIFTNITDEEIAQGDDKLAPSMEDLGLSPDGKPLPGSEPDDGDKPFGGSDGPDGAPDKPRNDKTSDSADALPLRDWQGFQLLIETEAGDVRKGNGWAVRMPAHYGFIRGTSSAEGRLEQMDCFLAPGPGESPSVHVFDVGDPVTGAFDEHKIFLGFGDEAAARACFEAAYHDARTPMGVTELTVEGLRRWLRVGDVTKALAGQARLQAVR